MRTTRNFSIHLTKDQKEVLKELARESGLSLTEYVEAVLNEAAAKEDRFERKLVKREPLPA